MTEPLRPSAAPAAERRVVRLARRGERPRALFFRPLILDRNLVERVLNDAFDSPSLFETQSLPVFGLIPALAEISVAGLDESNESEEEQNGRSFN